MTSVNKLLKTKEFKTLLEDYRPSQDNLNFVSELKLVFMVGPTASGRNTLINILISSGKYHYVVSDTTRKPRINDGKMEENGVEYCFLSEDDMLDGLERGDYLEAAIIHEQQVSGISFREIKNALRSGKIAIDEIEVEGAANLKRLVPESLFVFLLPPTFDIWMQRLNGRGELSSEEVRRRLVSAVNEITVALETDFYQFVTNNEIHEAAAAVDELAHGRLPDDSKQQQGIEHAKQLIEDVKQHIDSL